MPVGHAGASATGFAFDNESPRRTGWLAPFALASRPVSNGEFLDFIQDGGYRQPALWLSDGWAQVQAQGWQAPADAAPLRQLHGEVWQWTASAYAPYPGFRPLAGPAAEYNGKFMLNQLALRGSSFATPDGHARHSYRNFFPAAVHCRPGVFLSLLLRQTTLSHLVAVPICQL